MNPSVENKKVRTFPLPAEYRQPVPRGPVFFRLTQTLSDLKLNTVCEEAKCPNRTECYGRGTLTFQILGDICTRRCGFCAETTGIPYKVDSSEPQRVLDAVRKLNLKHVVITAPARDDLPDGGAAQFARTVALLKNEATGVTVEILISDLAGSEEALSAVLAGRPHVFNHNLETVRRLTPRVRAKATYDRSLEVLSRASAFFSKPENLAFGFKTKSGLMVGLGETAEELAESLRDLKDAGVQYLTVGQYLQPSPNHLSIEKYYAVHEFKAIRKSAEELGFENISCGPLIRSSYHAEEMAAARGVRSA